MYTYDIPVEVRLNARDAIREFAPSMSDDACDKITLRLFELAAENCSGCEERDARIEELEEQLDEEGPVPAA